MNYHVEKNNPKTAYLQLYEQLRGQIVQGVYPYGSRLPSKRMLAAETGLSVIPVEHAYGLLCEEGYAEARERSGYYVIYRQADFVTAPVPPAEAPLWGEAEPLPLLHGDFPFSLLAKKMRKVLTEYGEKILVKSPNQGCAALRGAIAAYLARSNGLRVLPEQIVIGSGAEYLYSMLVQLLGKEQVFAIEEPCYGKIRQVYQANGVTCQALALGPDGIRSEYLQSTAATVLHVTPFHSYPSGISAGASKRQEYLRWAQERSGYLIEDNYDSELTVSRKNEDTLFAADGGKRVIYLNTFSRTIAPSIRIGYMILPLSLLEVFEAKLGFYSCTVPVFEQYVLTELLQSGDFERHINRVRRLKRSQN